MVLMTVRRNLLNYEARLLHGCTAVLELSGHFARGFFQSAIEAKGLRFLGADSSIGAVPLRWRIENLLGPLHDSHVGFCDRRPGFGVIAGRGFARRLLRLRRGC